MLVKDNPYIPTEDRDFFILLRIGLWQKVEEPLSPSPDWPYIYRLSCEQTVQGIVADGVALYKAQHPDLQITQEQNDQFLSATAQIVRRNYQINQLQARICQLFADNNIQYVVLKGQAVAQAYPKPMLRVSGDIDYLFNEENYYKAIELLKPVASNHKVKDEKQRNADFFFDDLEIELHLDEFIALGNTQMNTFSHLRDIMFADGAFRSYDCNSTSVQLPPIDFDCFYTFLHFYKHYWHGGLGLRQIIDWMMLTHKHEQEIKTDTLNNLLSQFDVQDKLPYFSQFAIEALGCPSDNIISATHTQQHLDLIWTNCKCAGNFGHNDISYADSFLKRNTIRVRKDLQWALNNYKEYGLYVIPITLKSIWELITIIPNKIKTR